MSLSFNPRGSCITKSLETKFDDFNVGSVFRKLTYPIGHWRFAKNPNPTLKARIWFQMEFCNSLPKKSLDQNPDFSSSWGIRKRSSQSIAWAFDRIQRIFSWMKTAVYLRLLVY